MAYAETTFDPVDSASYLHPRFVDFIQYYDDLPSGSPLSPKFYVDGVYHSTAQHNYTGDYTIKADFATWVGPFADGNAHTWRIDVYNHGAGVWVTGTTHSFHVVQLPQFAASGATPHGATGVSILADISFSYAASTYPTYTWHVWWRTGFGVWSSIVLPYGTLSFTPPGGLLPSRLYNWWVEVHNSAGGGERDSRDEDGYYSFTTGDGTPSKPTNPTPADAASDIVLSTDEVTWDDGGGSDDYDVYFGPTGSMTLRESGQVGTTWDIPFEVLLYETSYSWRIDATNAYGTTTGDTWSFDTIVFYPPVPSGEVSGAGGEHGGEGGKNNMVTVKRLVAAANNTIFFEDE